MTENLPSQQQSPESQHEAANVPLELIDDIATIEGQFVESLEQLAVSEVDDMTADLMEAPAGQMLQEKYGIAYNPFKVVTGMADIAMLASSPELLRERVELGTVEAMEEGKIQETIYRENGLAYAQDQPETEKYVPEATKIIDALINGDESLLGALPQDFVEALRARIKSYENGVSSDEREAMISVACNGLRKKHGEELPLEGSKEAKEQDERWEQAQQQDYELAT